MNWKKGVSIMAAIGLCASLCMASAPAVSAADKSSPLYGKTALFCGDSIGWGQWDNETRDAFAGRIADQYGMRVNNASVGGSSLSTVRDARIVDQVKNSRQFGPYEYVILQGGVNDAWGNVETGEYAPWGEMSDSFDYKDFDVDTYAGALEELFYFTFRYNPDAKVGYIYTFATPTSGLGHTGDMEPYYAVADKICAKWGVQVLDLYHDRYVSNDMLEVKTAPNAYLMDALHPTAAGYDRLAPYIGEWMERMTDTETYKANPYENKRVLFLGDSISAGYGDQSKREIKAWAGRMQEELHIQADNRSISGLSLSTIRSARVIDPMKAAPTNAYDYVIMHGGINDAWGNNFKETPPAPTGKITDSYSPVDFDISTFAGALEELFFNAYLRFPSARLGYIINFNLNSEQDMGLYDDVAREICKKWKVACLDMHNDKYVTETLLDNNSAVYLPDGAHPSAKGYDRLTPYIIDWFKTIPYANISDFEDKMPPTDKIPDEEDTRVVMEYIRDIGEVTAKNYKEKRELIEEAEFQLSDYLVVYGDGCVIYIENYKDLKAARAAYDQFVAASKTTKPAKTTKPSKQTTAATTTADTGITDVTESTTDATDGSTTVTESTTATSATAESDATQSTTGATLPTDTDPANNTGWGWLVGIGSALLAAAAGVGGWFLWKRKKAQA